MGSAASPRAPAALAMPGSNVGAPAEPGDHVVGHRLGPLGGQPRLVGPEVVEQDRGLALADLQAGQAPQLWAWKRRLATATLSRRVLRSAEAGSRASSSMAKPSSLSRRLASIL